MKTSYKKTEKLIQNPMQNQNINVTPFTPRKQLNFTSNKAKNMTYHVHKESKIEKI